MAIPRPLLPPELERIVVELAARSDQDTAFALSHVSSGIRDWVKPSLHRVYTITPDRPAGLAWLRGAIQDPPSTTLVATHLCALFLSGDGVGEHAADILRACPNIETLSISNDALYDDFMSDMSDLKSLRKLSIDLEEICKNMDLNFPYFQLSFRTPFSKLTHLEILKTPDENSRLVACLANSRFFSLTHLALPGYPLSDEFMDKLLRHPSVENMRSLTLVAFVVPSSAYEEERALAYEESAKDSRVVVIPQEDRVKDWEDDAWGNGEGMWERARKRLEARRPVDSGETVVDSGERMEKE
ncbi:hypothetical protein HMN09_00915300 [Mycena chlorophos]|uniref:Uncharacterized protein n=1 Tax=Mycena chlorophos TaxID=658473 RepID=A0A8H6SII5_MYCCL|nr:hypothetical protein HMN09_00915300 [Mycena chlorophos]